MTPYGLPETEREITLALHAGVTARELMADPLDDGCVSLLEAAERLGVPVLVLQRWCEDGTVSCVTDEGAVVSCVRGRPERPGAVRIERAWVDDFMERGEVTL